MGKKFFESCSDMYRKVLNEVVELKAPADDDEVPAQTAGSDAQPAAQEAPAPAGDGNNEAKEGNYSEVKSVKKEGMLLFHHKDLVKHIKDNNELGLGSVFSKEFFDKADIDKILSEVDPTQASNNVLGKDLDINAGYDLVRKRSDVEKDAYKTRDGKPYTLELEKKVGERTFNVTAIYSTKDISSYATKRLNMVLVKVDATKTTDETLKAASKDGNAWLLLTMFVGQVLKPVDQWKDDHYVVVPVKAKADGKLVVDDKGNVVPQEIK